MTIRAARQSDAREIARLENNAGDTRWSAEAVASSLSLATTRAFVDEDLDLIGHALASSAGGTGELLTIAVTQGRRRQGIGTRLLEACHAAWRADGVEESFLEVRATNHPALALYTRHGWTRTAVRAGYYPDGGDAVVMRWAP